MAKSKFPAEGGCTCRAVRYRMTSEPMIVHCCHCTWCQRETGSAFVLNAVLETSRLVVLSGIPETIKTPSSSGKGQKIVRCPDCRVALWSHYAGAGLRVAFVRVGTMEKPDLCPPNVHIYTSTKQKWLTLSDTVPVFRGYYRRDTVWSPESLKRRKALNT